VLDVTPRELRDERVHPSKQEYPRVIFPLVRERGLRAYAGEPDEPRFSAIVQGLSRALTDFRATHPELAAADRAYESATYAALARLWSTPARVNGPLTDQMLAARRRYQDEVAGDRVADAWRRWTEHTVSVVRRAAGEHPGRRILVLVGVENAPQVRGALRRHPELELVDVEAWLRHEGGEP
jgi:hypothetical protein